GHPALCYRVRKSPVLPGLGGCGCNVATNPRGIWNSQGKRVFASGIRFYRKYISKAQLDDNGIWHGQVDDLYLRWQGAENATQADDGGLQFELQLAEGQEQLFTLELSRKPLPTHPVTPEEVPKSTRWNWQRTVANIPRPDRSDDI